MHAISSYHGNKPTKAHTHTHTHTNMKKLSERRKHCARALAVVRFGYRPPATNTPTNTRHHRQDR